MKLMAVFPKAQDYIGRKIPKTTLRLRGDLGRLSVVGLRPTYAVVEAYRVGRPRPSTESRHKSPMQTQA